MDQNDRQREKKEEGCFPTVSRAGLSHSISLLALSLRDCRWPHEPHQLMISILAC